MGPPLLSLSLGRSPAKPQWGSSPLAGIQGAVTLCGALQRFSCGQRHSFSRRFLQPLMHPSAQRPAEPHQLLPALPCRHPRKGCRVLLCLAAQHCVHQLPFRGRRGAGAPWGALARVWYNCTRETSPSLAPIAERFKAGSGCAWGPAITHPLEAERGGEGQPVLHCIGAASRPPGPRGVMQGRCCFGLWKSPFLSGSERFC